MIRRLGSLVCLSACIAAQGQEAPAPLQVGLPEPALLDLRQADASALVPGEDRDPARLEAARKAWDQLLEPLPAGRDVLLMLPAGPHRLPLLLASSQALRARDARTRVFVAHQPELPPLMDDLAWGAVEGGALPSSALGQDPSRWRKLLEEAQSRFPGRPWYLWLPSDPGAQAAQLMGDGGRLVLPAGGPGAALARLIPSGYTEVEGGLGDLTLRRPGTEETLRWLYRDGAWVPTKRKEDRHEVQVTDSGSYDVGALLARVRATQLRDNMNIQSVQAIADLDFHIQDEQGGGDLGFRFRSFKKAGEAEELLREEVRFNGVRANVSGTTQLPIIQSRTSVAAPIALTLTERYRYSDGGPAGPGRRILRFRPVDNDPLLFQGELVVEEASGRVLQERSHRSGMPGMVRSERRELTYGEAVPGAWRVLGVRGEERWASAGGTVQVLRELNYRDFQVNAPGFDSDRQAARTGNGMMMVHTSEGYRYSVKQADGTRAVEHRLRSQGKAVGGMLVMRPGQDVPVAPVAGLVLFDYNAFDREVQYSFLTVGVFNMGSLAVPRAFWGLDFSASGTLSLITSTERPVKDGRELDKDGVDRRQQYLNMALGRDLGAGFRLEVLGEFTHDAFRLAGDEKYRTPGYKLPPSGWTRLGGGQLSWQSRGFQLRGTWTSGLRPTGTYGAPGAIVDVPEEGRVKRWEGAATYDRKLGKGLWLHTVAGHASGSGFDRFNPLSFDGRVSGIKPYGVVVDRMTFGGASLAIPTGPNLRLTLGLDHAVAHSLDDKKNYAFTGMKVAGDMPGFWWFTTIRVDLGVGLKSDVKGLRCVTGMVSFLHLF